MRVRIAVTIGRYSGRTLLSTNSSTVTRTLPQAPFITSWARGAIRCSGALTVRHPGGVVLLERA